MKLLLKRATFIYKALFALYANVYLMILYIPNAYLRLLVPLYHSLASDSSHLFLVLKLNFSIGTIKPCL